MTISKKYWEVKRWFDAVLSRQVHPPVYFEFGVGRGTMLATYLLSLREVSMKNDWWVPACTVIGFDSFKGLPEKSDVRDDSPNWVAGQYAYSQDAVRKMLSRYGLELDTLQFFAGYFKDVLTPELAHLLRDVKPDIVVVDCDYYSSAKSVLEWLRPLLKDGAYLYFDDINVPWRQKGLNGELAAIQDFNMVGEGVIRPCLNDEPRVGKLGFRYMQRSS